MSELMAARILRVSLISFLVLVKELSNETVSFIQCSPAPLGFICLPILLVTARTLFPAMALKSLVCDRSIREESGDQSFWLTS